MFAHTLKLILRVLYRDKLYASINIVGLALAIACCLILGLYLHEELTYDRHYEKHERVFRVAGIYEDYDTGNQREESAISSPALGPILARDFPEVEAFVRNRPGE